MKFQSSKNLCACAFAVALVFVSFSCQSAQTSSNQTAVNPAAKVQKTINPQTPTEAYQLLFAAVKAKDTGKIQQILSLKSNAMAISAAKQYNHSLEKQLENGMLETTMTDALPDIRDERVKDNFGAIEVFNHKTNQWDDTAFIFEDGGWRLAVGDQFADTYKSPGKSQAQIAAQAANSTGNNMIKITPNMNGGKVPTISDSTNVKTAQIPIEPRSKTPKEKK
ncbi:MAG: hypothetical protein M3033_11665 [Acidobacteriota bacterium]|nr:hypothetical protein [Acidobacteriota bacterium]